MSSVGMRRLRVDLLDQNALTHPFSWDDDVVFKNQARGTEDKKKKEFVNVSKVS